MRVFKNSSKKPSRLSITNVYQPIRLSIKVEKRGEVSRFPKRDPAHFERTRMKSDRATPGVVRFEGSETRDVRPEMKVKAGQTSRDQGELRAHR